MSSDQFNYQGICPHCGKVLTAVSPQCPSCGQRLGKTRAESYRQAGPSLLSRLGPLVKPAVILLVLGLPALGLWYLFHATLKSVDEANPYPKDPQVAVTEFFEGLALGTDQGYQQAYGLLGAQPKAATLLQKNSRLGYYTHFARIRAYLVERVGPDFIDRMALTGQDSHVTAAFDDHIVLNADMRSIKDFNEQYRYTIKGIREFPIDMLPNLGVEQRNRQLEQAMNDDGMGTPQTEIVDPADVIVQRPGESDGQYLQRMIQMYPRARLLDVRHAIFDAIVDQFPNERATAKFLRELTRDSTEAVHLRRQAEYLLGTPSH